MKKSVVLSVRITDDLDRALTGIAGRYNISCSHLVSSVLTSFCLEFSKGLVENFVINEDPSDNQ